MAEIRNGKGPRALAILTILVVAPAVGLTAMAADPKEKEREKATAPKDEAGEAREILKAFQDLGAAVRKDEKAAARGRAISTDEVLRALGRPQRTVAKTSLDAAAVDALLEKGLAEAKVTPARLVGDEEFIRRAYLDVTGKLPTPEQVLAFLRSKDKHKRAALIDHLLASPDYAQNWARYWRDVVRFHATVEQPRLVNYPKFEEWLAEQFAKNTPWDEVARRVIAATGTTEENGATSFTAAHMAQPVEIAGEVSRIFLGVQIQCAQCHDHPNDPWKRQQFHEFAAFFAGTQARRNGKGADLVVQVATRPGAPRYTMPDLKDPQKSIPVQPKFFLASSEATLPAGLTAQQRREVAASYVTGQDNPWFAKAFVNRTWYALLGESFYTPVDDMGPTRSANAPEVLDTLAAEWAKGGYDVRWLFRTILNTKAYQREFRPVATAAGKTPFAANCPGRLRADQILDALSQALGIPFDGAAGRAAGLAKAKGAQAPVAAKAVRALGGPRGLFNLLFGVDPSTPNDDVLGTIPQALFMMNSPQISRAIQARPGTVLGEILTACPDNRTALEALYLKVLARRPTADEVKTCGNYLMRVGDRREAFEDILWALINSTEFVSRR
jgi:hypothetical protein